ncbi:hypothetical protein [Nocardia sp. NBC_01388]|uniref:hypothetical protein n=1 Tax=Nocardia sp. NBC_01388 TaxID=2903596 RepID=UPI00324F1EEE
MWLTILLSITTGLMAVNAAPHFIKGIAGEQFPNIWGNSSLRNAIAGTLGLALAVLLGLWADMPAHLAPALAAATAGALLMAVFHGLRGAYRLNTALGLPNPPQE